MRVTCKVKLKLLILQLSAILLVSNQAIWVSGFEEASEDELRKMLEEHKEEMRTLPRGCAMRGICGKHGHLSQNCAAPTFAIPTNISDATELIQLCPRLFTDGPVQPLCCDKEQQHILRQQMNIARDLLSRCPSCYSNFVHFWCNFACSLRQKQFVVVKTEQVDEHSTVYGSEREAYATEVDIYVARDYAERIFESCKDVKFSSGYALDLMCGESRRSCDYRKWFGFMGRYDGQNVPFNIIFHFTDAKQLKVGKQRIAPLNEPTYGCDQSSDLSLESCSCSDCQKLCQNEKVYPTIENREWSYDDPVLCNVIGGECKVASMECMSGLSLVAAGALLLVIMGSFVVYYCMGKSTAEDMTGISPNTTFPATTASLKSAMTDQQNPKFKKPSYRIDNMLISWSQWYGRYAIDHPTELLCGSILVALLCSAGLLKLTTTTDPVELWSNSESQLRQEKAFFDQTFKPFHRVTQLIIYPRDQKFVLLPNITKTGLDDYFGPIYNKTFLLEVFHLYRELIDLRVWNPETNQRIHLRDICYKPLEPDNKNCAIMSVFNYFQNSMEKMNITASDDEGMFDFDYSAHLQQCFAGPFTMQTLLNLSCLGEFGGPVEPFVVLGDFNKTNDYNSARGLVITFLLENHLNKEKNKAAMEWEKAFVDKLKNHKNEHYYFSFMTESSIEGEIDRASSSDKVTVIISYVFMFIYVAFALGQYRVSENQLGSLFVNSKFTLGIAGVIVVALSVSSSIGLFAFYGIPATMIILEVQPFLILAVGVDNIFLFVQAYQRHAIVSSQLPLKDRIAIICGEVIPSMLLSSLSESTCFFLGAITDMPAVKTFSLYAGLAILFNFAFQGTCFLALFILDVRRQEAGRAEFFWWLKYKKIDNTYEESFMYRFFKNYYAPALLKPFSKFLVSIVFALWFASSCLVMRNINLGLDEKMAVPEDSYMLTHFRNMDRFMSVGPPVYFVINGKLSYEYRRVQNRICGGTGCEPDSLGAQIARASRFPQNSYISHPVMNWVDDYIAWLQPSGSPPCCRFYRTNGSFCPATQQTQPCASCNVTFFKGRPAQEQFYNHLDEFLQDNPSKECTKGGKAAFLNALDFHTFKGIKASYFMTYHSPLKSQADFIRAMDSARWLAKNISCTINQAYKFINNFDAQDDPPITVFAYSPYYVFYEQYETIVWAAIVQLMLSLVVIFIVTFFILGMDPWSAMIIVGTIACILVNLIGLMYWWGIDFNAISVVNLVMSVGISVEFCSHIVRGYSLSYKRTRSERTHEALANIGCSVLSGITFTKFGGVIVLAFAHTQIFQVFYFRMFFGIVIIGGLHGLVFLPVLLSMIGPPPNKQRTCEILLAEGHCLSNLRSVAENRVPASSLELTHDLSVHQKLFGFKE